MECQRDLLDYYRCLIILLLKDLRIEEQEVL